MITALIIFSLTMILSVPIWFRDNVVDRDIKSITTEKAKVGAINHRYGEYFYLSVVFELPYTWAGGEFKLLGADMVNVSGEKQNLNEFVTFIQPDAAQLEKARSESLFMDTEAPLDFEFKVMYPETLKELGYYNFVLAGEICKNEQCLPLGYQGVIEIYEVRKYYVPLRDLGFYLAMIILRPPI